MEISCKMPSAAQTSWADRLNDRRMCSGQDLAVASARTSSACLSGRTRPMRSAVGMKSAGETGSRRGLFQRARTSKPAVCSLMASTIGWNTRAISAPNSEVRKRFSMTPRLRILASSSLEKITVRPRSWRLA
jgi:hypothetical protein